MCSQSETMVLGEGAGAVDPPHAAPVLEPGGLLQPVESTLHQNAASASWAGIEVANVETSKVTKGDQIKTYLFPKSGAIGEKSPPRLSPSRTAEGSSRRPHRDASSPLRVNGYATLDTLDNRNSVINEFRDTIGFCEVRLPSSVGDAPADILKVDLNQLHPIKYATIERCNDSSTFQLPATSSRTSQGISRSFKSLNTEIMEILTDLDAVLDMSLIEDPEDVDTTSEPSFESALTDITDTDIDVPSFSDVKKDLNDVKQELAGIKEELSGIKSDLTSDCENGDIVDTESDLLTSTESDVSESVSAMSSIETITIQVTEPDDDPPDTPSPLRTGHEVDVPLGETCVNARKMTPPMTRSPIVRSAREHLLGTDVGGGRADGCREELGRRASMRRLRPLCGASAPPLSAPPSPELSLSARLFLESQEPGRYGGEMRPQSAGAAPRARGRRSQPARRCGSLHVSPGAPPSPVRIPELTTIPQNDR